MSLSGEVVLWTPKNAQENFCWENLIDKGLDRQANTKADVNGNKYVDRIHLAQKRDKWWDLANKEMNSPVPKNAENMLTSCATISFSRMKLGSGEFQQKSETLM